MLRYITSLLVFLLITSGAWCQQKAPTDSIPAPPKDTIKGKFIPTGLRVGAELIGLGKTVLNDDFHEYHVQADIDFYRYFLNFDYGVLEQTLTSENGLYNVEGSYFRVGPDINFLHQDPDRSALFFGLRYSQSKFSDQLEYSYDNQITDEGANTVSNTDLKATWYEMVAGMKVKVWKTVWLGYTARFKFSADTFENNQLIPYYIPGYGRAAEDVIWDFDYYLIIRIPVRKQPQPLSLKQIKDN